MHYLTGFQPTSYSLTVISASVCMCDSKEGSHHANYITSQRPTPQRMYSYKYLGLLLTSDLFWSAHISTLCSKARQQIGMLYCKFYRYSDMETLKHLCVAFSCPNLEYATSVSAPHLSKDIQKLESVQRFACRVCTKRWNHAYSDVLHTLNIPPLSEWRKLLKMCHLYKIVQGFIDFPNAPVVYKPCTNH